VNWRKQARKAKKKSDMEIDNDENKINKGDDGPKNVKSETSTVTVLEIGITHQRDRGDRVDLIGITHGDRYYT
jgi:hypothetical protein